MKRTHLLPTASLALALLSTLNPQLSTCFAQGSLTPPGAPGPTMKTLAQIEPRTPISAAPFTVTSAGSYYLTTNLTVASGNAITIATNGVTLDLGGFTIASTAASATGYGILINSGLRNLSIVNGFIQGGVTNNGGDTYNGPGFQYGIMFSSVGPVNTRVAGVSVSGMLTYGIYVGYSGTTIESCSAQTIGQYGLIAASVLRSSAIGCAWTAIFANVASDCYGVSQDGSGIDSSSLSNCFGQSTSGAGLRCAVAHNCWGGSISGTGLFAYYTAQNSYGNTGSGTGLFASTALNCYGYSSSGAAGLSAANASFCTGSRSGGTAIQATVATGCYADSGTNSITHKYNMP